LLQIPSHVKWRLEDGEMVVFDPIQGKVHVLNAVASKIWALLDTEKVMTDIVEELSGRYPEIPTEKIRQDVDAFVRELTQKGLLKSDDH